MENDSNSKSSPSLSEDSFDDASSRRTIALDLVESTPAPAHFRAQPSATGAGEYSWAARVDKLTLRLDKLQLRVEALEDSFADPDDPTKDELDKLYWRPFKGRGSLCLSNCALPRSNSQVPRAGGLLRSAQQPRQLPPSPRWRRFLRHPSTLRTPPTRLILPSPVK